MIEYLDEVKKFYKYLLMNVRHTKDNKWAVWNV